MGSRLLGGGGLHEVFIDQTQGLRCGRHSILSSAETSLARMRSSFHLLELQEAPLRREELIRITFILSISGNFLLYKLASRAEHPVCGDARLRTDVLFPNL